MLDDIRIYTVDAQEPVGERDVEFLMGLPSAEEAERLRRFRRREDLLRSLFGDALVRYEGARRGLGRVELARTERGKPFCTGGGFTFNISHSGRWVAGIFAEDLPVGIDIEEIGTGYEEIWGHVLSLEEMRIMKEAGAGLEDEAFVRMWTLKEACLKWQGAGLFRDPCEVVTSSVFTDEPVIEGGSVNAWTSRYDDGYILTACCQRKIEKSIERVSVEEIVRRLKGAYDDGTED